MLTNKIHCVLLILLLLLLRRRRRRRRVSLVGTGLLSLVVAHRFKQLT